MTIYRLSWLLVWTALTAPAVVIACLSWTPIVVVGLFLAYACMTWVAVMAFSCQ